MENNADLENVDDVSIQTPEKKVKLSLEELIDSDIQPPKKEKHSKKSTQVTNNTNNTVTKPRKCKDKIKSSTDDCINNEIIKKTSGNDNIQNDESIDWPQADLSNLLKKIELALPENDSLMYSTRVEKLNWDDIAFEHYSAEDCKKTWLFIQKRIRHFRLLTEVLQDAKEWINKSWTDFYKRSKTKQHPDMPKQPLSAYTMFYLKKKNEILSENSGMEMTEMSKKIAQIYKTISPAERKKYMQQAAAEKKAYDEKLQLLSLIKPEIPCDIEKTTPTKVIETSPKKPSTPFELYFKKQLKNLYSESDGNRSTFKQQCKEQWKNLPDKKKLVWIDQALDEGTKYQDTLKTCTSQNSNYVPPTSVKPVLNKKEKLLKERLAGKPAKPPVSAYGLYSRVMLQGKEIKKVHPWNRMKVVAIQWKNCSDKEKRLYKERADHMIKQYKIDFASYLESLPKDKREEELQNNLPKRKIKEKDAVILKRKKIRSIKNEINEDNKETEVNGINNTNEESSKCNEENKNNGSNGNIVEHGVKVDNNKTNKDTILDKVLKEQPSLPPVSGFSLFSKRYHGKNPVKTAWKNLSEMERQEYEIEVQKLKQKYCKEFENFLKSLTRKELIAYSEWKKKEVPVTSDSNNSEVEESSCCESESEDDLSNKY